MMIVRHAEFRDLEDIYKLAGKSGVGLTSLPKIWIRFRLEFHVLAIL